MHDGDDFREYAIWRGFFIECPRRPGEVRESMPPCEAGARYMTFIISSACADMLGRSACSPLAPFMRMLRCEMPMPPMRKQDCGADAEKAHTRCHRVCRCLYSMCHLAFARYRHARHARYFRLPSSQAVPRRMLAITRPLRGLTRRHRCHITEYAKYFISMAV